MQTCFGENKLKAFGSRFYMLAVLAMLVLNSCTQENDRRQVERSIYHWKSTLRITGFEKERLNDLNIQTIYLKFFDVDWDVQQNRPVPVAKLSPPSTTLPLLDIDGANNSNANFIPVVFITNNCIQKTDSSEITKLGDHIYQLLIKMMAENGLSKVPEIQFDCDWTAATKQKYFKLLEVFRSKFNNTTLSATIRLHQVKFLAKTGVPPVDRGLLMCYNMGNLQNPATKNSILETTELKKYTANLASYPLPLDVALPIFEWKVLFRNNFYAGLLQNLPENVLTETFVQKSGNRFYLLKDTMLAGYDLRKGDMIRNEQSNIKELLAAADIIGKQIKNTKLRVSLYHLDSVLLKKYSIHELESIYNRLR